MAIQTLNPATGEIVKIFEEITEAELEKKIAKAQAAFEMWRNTSFAERAALMMKMAKYLEQNKDRLGALQTLEMGKTLASAAGSAAKCGSVCEYYAQNAEKMLADEPAKTEASETFVSFEPLGIVFAVMPWNFPLWQVYRFAAPAIMAGNVALLKHASNVPQCAIAMEDAFREVGFPEGVFTNLLLSAKNTEKVIRDPRIKAVTLTGSEKAGASVASIAAQEIKKAVLELGGSDPFIVLEDADMPYACEMAATARMQNNTGQSCISAKRFIVMENIADKFIAGMIEQFKNLKIGDPMDPATQVGPLATEQILKDIEEQVTASVAQGAKLELGGKRWQGEGKLANGFFYEPTILSGVKKGMTVYEEETFGPVASVITVKSADEAIAVANDTKFGLGASIWTANTELAKQMARKIEAGQVFVNQMVKSDPRIPFGGVKHSGYGRELSHYGIKEFVNIKTILVK